MVKYGINYIEVALVTVKHTVELPLSRSGALTQKLIRNPAMPSDEPSNKTSVNIGLRLIVLHRLRRLLDVAGLANYYRLQREAQPRAAQ